MTKTQIKASNAQVSAEATKAAVAFISLDELAALHTAYMAELDGHDADDAEIAKMFARA